MNGGQPALRRLWDILPQARVVGGAVRDRLAGLVHADHDLASPDTPDAIIRKLGGHGIKTVPTGLAHGTVTAIVDHVPFEITTLRRDVRTDGRHAETEWTADWREDAARRDFTVNAMSLDREGTVHDYFGGRDDLAQGRIRFVGDAARRIEEDHLRILRFFRFHARFGRADPDADALRAIRDGAPLVERLSAERVWSELKRLLAGPRQAETLCLMADLGVLSRVVAEGADPCRLLDADAIGAPADPILRAAFLLTGSPAAFAERLRLSGDEAGTLRALLGGPSPTADDDDDALRRLLAETPATILIGRSWLAQGGRTMGWAALRERLASMQRPVFPLAGRDAVALGVASGPRVGEALRAVHGWWLARGARDGREACLVELARQLSAVGPN